MQERRRNDDEYFSGPADKNTLMEALTKEANKSVTLHRPGSEIRLPSGAVYRVQNDGSWKRIDAEAKGK